MRERIRDNGRRDLRIREVVGIEKDAGRQLRTQDLNAEVTCVETMGAVRNGDPALGIKRLRVEHGVCPSNQGCRGVLGFVG